MKRTNQIIDYRGGRRRQRHTETTTRTIEDLAEVQEFKYQRIESDYTGAWKAGVNLALVVTVSILIAAGLALLSGASLAWLPVVAVVAIPACAALPPALTALYNLKTHTSIQRRQYIDAQALHQASQRRYVQTYRQLVETSTEAEYRLADVQQRMQHRQLAMNQKQQLDLSQFVAAVFVRGESPAFRNWQKRQLPSGQPLTHKRWKDELIQPLLTVGALLEPNQVGKPYDVVGADFQVVESRLKRAGYIE